MQTAFRIFVTLFLVVASANTSKITFPNDVNNSRVARNAANSARRCTTANNDIIDWNPAPPENSHTGNQRTTQNNGTPIIQGFPILNQFGQDLRNIHNNVRQVINNNAGNQQPLPTYMKNYIGLNNQWSNDQYVTTAKPAINNNGYNNNPQQPNFEPYDNQQPPLTNYDTPMASNKPSFATRSAINNNGYNNNPLQSSTANYDSYGNQQPPVTNYNTPMPNNPSIATKSAINNNGYNNNPLQPSISNTDVNRNKQPSPSLTNYNNPIAPNYPSITTNPPLFENPVSNKILQLAFSISRETTNSEQSWASKNIAFGPLTIAGALAMVLLASVGKTYDEIAHLMGYGPEVPYYDVHRDLGCFIRNFEASIGAGSNEVVKYAIGMFVQIDYPIRPEFANASQKIYHNQVQHIDFRRNPVQAQNIINNWVSQLTNSKINKLFNGPLPAQTNVVIASVLYFKALWEYPFFNDQTKQRPFYSNGRSKPSDKTVNMMYNAGEFKYFKDRINHIEIMGFPYKGEKTTMYVIVPEDSDLARVNQIEGYQLTPDYIKYLLESMTYKEAIVGFPKVKIEATINLKSALNNLNVSTLFKPNEANLGLLSRTYANAAATPGATEQQQAADRLIFSRFNDDACNLTLDSLQQLASIRNEVLQSNINPRLYADEIVHKVYIDITESGTEAAAVTGISLNRSGGRVVFRLDVPFIFFIFHEPTSTVLFLGSFKSPP